MEMSDALCNAYREAVDVKLCKLEVMIGANKAVFDERVRSSDKALKIAQDILDYRMEAENKIREELREQTNSFMTRSEYTVKHDSLVDKIDTLSKESSKLDGRMVAMVFIIPIILSAIMGIIFHLLSK